MLVNTPPEYRYVSYVPQDYAFSPHLTVYEYENVAFGLRARNFSESDIKRRVKELIDFIGLNGIENKYPHQLSSGEKQKVALARALAPEPKVILLDEPLSSIDPSSKEYIRWELREFPKKLKITILIVTHNLNDAWALADRIMVMLRGNIICSGSPDDILSRIKSKEAARFLGLNALKGTVISKNGSDITIYSREANIKLIAKDKSNNINKGDKVLVLFRLDDITIHSKEDNIEAVNSIEAKILGVQVTKCNIKCLYNYPRTA
ncbi:MAG: hypothetical protein DRO15_03485 [Thermoprotei archaeon]|nr:MAG: hypothetical protein DRO15_03485 [Thermoprotei archaeon]